MSEIIKRWVRRQRALLALAALVFCLIGGLVFAKLDLDVNYTGAGDLSYAGYAAGKIPYKAYSDTATVTLTHAESGTMHIFSGSSGAKIFNLPAAAPGDWFIFVRLGAAYASNLEINPDATTEFVGSTDGVGSSLILDEWNSDSTFCKIVCVSATQYNFETYLLTDSNGAPTVGSPDYCTAR
jgi:hypothetical protein